MDLRQPHLDLSCRASVVSELWLISKLVSNLDRGLPNEIRRVVCSQLETSVLLSTFQA